MGQTLADAVAHTPDMEVAAGVDIAPDARQNGFPVYPSIDGVTEAADVIIDFSRPDALHAILDYAQAHGVGAVLATTGYTDNDRMMIVRYAGHIPVFYSANMSLGVNLQIALAKKAAAVLQDKFDIEILEKHHNQKVDSPSGTALSIVEGVNTVFGGKKEVVFGRHAASQKRGGEIGVHAVRGGTVVGEHDVLFLGPDEALEINHRAYSKEIFAQGAIRAARLIVQKPPALYTMDDIFSEII
jgi:4-hydroxy-tetrahydrodipicolinate reductase